MQLASWNVVCAWSRQKPSDSTVALQVMNDIWEQSH